MDLGSALPLLQLELEELLLLLLLLLLLRFATAKNWERRSRRLEAPGLDRPSGLYRAMLSVRPSVMR